MYYFRSARGSDDVNTRLFFLLYLPTRGNKEIYREWNFLFRGMQHFIKHTTGNKVLPGLRSV